MKKTCMTDELIKFCEEIYKEASRLHFFEVSIKKVMQAIHDNAGDCRNANLKFNSLKGTFKNYKQGVNTNVEWYGKGENGNPRYTPEEFRRMLADAIANNYGNASDTKVKRLFKFNK